MKNRYYKLISALIAIAMLVCSIPMSATASDISLDAGVTEAFKPVYNDSALKKELREKKGLGVVEIESLRSEYAKHYQISDGTYQALTFGEPVHRKGADGKWIDIDNRLYKNDDQYRTQDGWFSFSSDLSDGGIYTVNDGTYSFSVGYSSPASTEKNVLSRSASKKAPLATVENHSEKASLSAFKTDAEKLEAASSVDTSTKILYENVFDGVDFEYIISANDIKENIILNENTGKNEFIFYIEVDGLKAETRADGSVQLFDAESGEPAYLIPAPYMYDSEGDRSDSVYYLLSEAGTGQDELKVVTDEDWLNASDTVYPVVIDPTISKLVLFDTYVYSSNPTTNYGDSEQLWVSSSRITYMRTPMPELPENANITYAVLNVKYYYKDTVTSGSVDIGLYQCLKNWDEYELTWNKANAWTNKGLSTTRSALSTATATSTAHASSPGTVSFSVTELVKQWCAGGANYGVGLKYEGGSNSSVILGAFEAGSAYRAQYAITYSTITPIVKNGTYFIKNAHLNNYLQIGDEYGPDYSNENAILELWDYDNEPFQEWNLTYLHNGYYKIESVKSGKVISVRAGEENSRDVSLRQATYTASYNQQWKISITHNGQYKFEPRSSESYSTDWCMAAGAAAVESITDGRNVEQREYTNNTGYKDEWFLIPSVDLSIHIGLSTDDYTDNCQAGERQSFRYANKFYEKLLKSCMTISKTHHYNNGSDRSASKNDFSLNGTFNNSIDFMVYIGHGLQADNSKGNLLHYNCASDGTYHTTDCRNSVYNVYTGDVKFGSDSSDLRWVWLYTCNFLTTNDYVTDDSLKEMMNGAHIVMGYASRATLCDAMAETFGKYLSEGRPIIDAYFRAGRDGEASVETADHKQKVLYVPQALNETIYSEPVDYDYNASNVVIEIRNIRSGNS